MQFYCLEFSIIAEVSFLFAVRVRAGFRCVEAQDSLSVDLTASYKVGNIREASLMSCE